MTLSRWRSKTISTSRARAITPVRCRGVWNAPKRAERCPACPAAHRNRHRSQSGQGVLGAQQAAGVQIAGSRGGSSGTTNATVSQVGPVTANLDPSIQESTTFSHRTSPQPNAVLSVTPVLIQGARNYTGSYQQGFLTGGSVTVSLQRALPE